MTHRVNSGAVKDCPKCGNTTLECIVMNYWQCPCEADSEGRSTGISTGFTWRGDMYFYPEDEPTLTGAVASTVRWIEFAVQGDKFIDGLGQHWIVWDACEGYTLFKSDSALVWYEFCTVTSTWDRVWPEDGVYAIT